MRVIFGIGNPGSKYSLTRHNAGFLFTDYMAEEFKIGFKASKSDYYFAESEYKGNPFMLVKPVTYVNNSGLALSDIAESYNINVEDILVVFDDINLDTGSIRVRIGGGDGGHNGIHSIIYHLQDNAFARMRIGIGTGFDNDIDMAAFVLSRFNNDELNIMEQTFKDGLFLAKEFVDGGVKQLLDANSRLPGRNINNSDTNRSN